jgi:hypothetical protein
MLKLVIFNINYKGKQIMYYYRTMIKKNTKIKDLLYKKVKRINLLYLNQYLII